MWTTSTWRTPARDDTIVRAAVGYAADRTGGGPPQRSPKVVGLVRIERVDAEPVLPPEVLGGVPDVLRARVARAAAERGVGPSWAAQALAAVDADT